MRAIPLAFSLTLLLTPQVQAQIELEKSWQQELSLGWAYNSELGHGLSADLATRYNFWTKGPWSSSIAFGGEFQYYPDPSELDGAFTLSPSVRPRVTYNFDQTPFSIFLESQLGGRYLHTNTSRHNTDDFRYLTSAGGGLDVRLTKRSAIRLSGNVSNSFSIENSNYP